MLEASALPLWVLGIQWAGREAGSFLWRAFETSLQLPARAPLGMLLPQQMRAGQLATPLVCIGLASGLAHSLATFAKVVAVPRWGSWMASAWLSGFGLIVCQYGDTTSKQAPACLLLARFCALCCQRPGSAGAAAAAGCGCQLAGSGIGGWVAGWGLGLFLAVSLALTGLCALA